MPPCTTDRLIAVVLGLILLPGGWFVAWLWARRARLLAEARAEAAARARHAGLLAEAASDRLAAKEERRRAEAQLAQAQRALDLLKRN